MRIPPFFRSRLPLLRGWLQTHSLSLGRPLGCGTQGCVFTTNQDAVVVKITRDPTEGPAARQIRDAQRRGLLRDIVRIENVAQLDEDAAVILRERIQPARISAVDQDLIYELSSVSGHPARSRVWPLVLGRKKLVPVARMHAHLAEVGLRAADILPGNLGRRTLRMKGWPSPGLVLHDVGQMEPSGRRNLVRGAAGKPASGRRPCPGQAALEKSFVDLLGVDASGGHCELVPQDELQDIARNHNWRAPDGIVGFHTPDDQIYVSDRHPWSVSHELSHRFYLQDKHLATWVCEGLSEFLAEEASSRTGEPHQATYPEYRALIQEHLVPAVGANPIQIARAVARTVSRGSRPDRLLANRIHANGTVRAGRVAIQRALGHRKPPEAFLGLLEAA